MNINENTIWNRIIDFEGEQFETIRGKPFKYVIDEDTVIPDRTGFPINKKHFFKVVDQLPIDGPGEISKLVMGSSYVWAILHDKRIRKRDW